MTKRITFSRVFPSYHPRKGEPTYFVEAILTQLGIDYTGHDYFGWLIQSNWEIDEYFLLEFFKSLKPGVAPKKHTIREHKKPMRVGDFINPLCWAGKPYHKTPEGYWQIKFAPDIRVDIFFEFEFIHGKLLDDKCVMAVVDDVVVSINSISQNDGLTEEDFIDWFNKPFKGSILCWDENVKY